ncbi:hypothetical protein [Bifidobacterium avesanii]|uniref:Uncharacterized protein n=1 Tax=Bifidobacterium avesanii TaxID=1798157 RepID=A0A7K3TET9_9BIFI|nr:hypothetical protein [Bifidobacterium avesanii]KAB8295430.1 hypothetical protein DSM100685_0040 [Bifidobacterium avesanii]NEG77436.1 hypothetical protein [Bifidobacterium avesanii]
MKSTARSIAAMATALMALTPLLGGCAGLGDNTANEQFVDGGAQTTARDWQAVADAITADGKVTRAETEQAITEYWNCMAINGFSGTYAIDLDVYHWSFLGSYGLNTDIVGDDGTPDTSGMDAEESQRVLAEWNRSKEGQAAFNRYVRLMGERKAPCQPLGDVEDAILSSIDWNYYQRNKFDAIQRCIAANAPTYADRARRVQYPTGPDADGEYQLIKEFGLYGESSPDGDKFMYAKAGTEEHRLRQCFNNPNGVPIVPFGADETLHDTGQPEG